MSDRADHKRGVVWFLVLAFGLAWAIEIGLYAAGVPLKSPIAAAGLVLVMFTPGIAAFIVRRFITCEGFADAGLRLGPLRYYAAAWFGMPVMAFLSLGLALLLGAAHWDPTMGGLAESLGREAVRGLPLDPRLMVLLMALFGILVAPWSNLLPAFGEEFGWRGYLQVRLDARLGRLWAYVLTGLIWGLWHAPIILQGYNYPDHPVLGVFAMMVFTILLSVLFGWLRDASGSVWPAALAHGALNATYGLPLLFSRGVDTLLGPALTGLTGWVVMLGAVLWLARRGAFRPAGVVPQKGD